MNDVELQKGFFHPVCNKNEIERIFNPQNAQDYLLKIRGETIVDHMRLFRVYRNKALLDEKNWSLEKSFNQTHYESFLKSLRPDNAKMCNAITYGNIFSNNPNGRIFISEFGPIITICDSLKFFIKFMNLGLMNFESEVPNYVRFNSLRIAIRVMLKTEALDFFMDPRGIVPKDIGVAIHSTINDQLYFIAGHEFSHYLLNHLDDKNTTSEPVLYAILPNEEDYNPLPTFSTSQIQEFEADENALLVPRLKKIRRKKLIESALLWFTYLDIYEGAIETISPQIPWGYKSHPTARDRYVNILNKIAVKYDINIGDWEKYLLVLDSIKKIIVQDISLHFENYEIYGSVYLDKPNSEWRGPELKDRIDYY